MVELFSKLIRLWNELENYVKCLVCKYEAAEKYIKLAERDRVYQFLLGLDDDLYSNMRS